ncbi:MAG: flippase-like domain-containing protein [Kastovskya adunca ATA6-11-RM4]|jgi:hypothetical protein|nr:flippase-like domain-containing protein [Kastovskya adunca ATA6-11-RM4]
MNKQKLSHLVGILISLLLLSLAIWVITRELKAYNYRDVLNSLTRLPDDRLLMGIILTILGYLVTSGYDVLALRYIRRQLPFPKTALAAFTSFCISNSVGFSFFTSSAIRYRLYSAWGLSKVEIAKIIAFGNLSFWLGMFAVGGGLFLVEPLAIPETLNLPITSAHHIGGIFLALVMGYLLLSAWSKRKSLKIGNTILVLPSLEISIAQIALSAIDWAIAGGVLYVLLTTESTLSFPAFFSIYLLAQVAGIVSHVPGGLGVFETVVVLLLAPTIPADVALGSLLAYRGIYYFLPLMVALLLLGGYELRRRLN